MFDWLKPKPKTDIELQAELKALVKRIIVEPFQYSFQYSNLMAKYEVLLREIYKRGLEPEAILEIKKEAKNE